MMENYPNQASQIKHYETLPDGRSARCLHCRNILTAGLPDRLPSIMANHLFYKHRITNPSFKAATDSHDHHIMISIDPIRKRL